MDRRDSTTDTRADAAAAETAAADLAVRRFVEQFALTLSESGVPRMASRVFAQLLADDAPYLTAGDLTRRLGVSPAAVSGAVRYLVQVGMVERGREPGDRTDHYLLRTDVWHETFVERMGFIRQWERQAAEGAALLGADRAGGRRLDETAAFFAFLAEELPRLLERWRDRRRELLPSDEADAPTG